MRIFSALLFSTLLTATAACVGQAPPSSSQQSAQTSQVCVPSTIDSDGDGMIDGIDTDCDGAVDIPICSAKLLDTDGDGVPDGLDTNCDGAIDIPLPGTGTGSGGGAGSGSAGGGSSGSGSSGSSGTSTSQCSVDVSINGQEEAISCTSTDGGPEECTCEVNGAVTSTCTTTSSSACSLPGNGNCCGF